MLSRFILELQMALCRIGNEILRESVVYQATIALGLQSVISEEVWHGTAFCQRWTVSHKPTFIHLCWALLTLRYLSQVMVFPPVIHYSLLGFPVL